VLAVNYDAGETVGWPRFAEQVEAVRAGIPAGERVAVLTANYGQAGAIDFFGPRYGLPRAISGHQNYFFWGPRSYTGEIVILVGEPESGARKEFSSVEVGATLDIPYAYFYETRPILLCRGLKGNLQAVWPRVKNWR